MLGLRKNGKAATAADLIRSRQDVATRQDMLGREKAEIEAGLPQILVDDPVAAAQSTIRLGQIESELGALEKALALIDDAIAEAEKGEALADIEARRDAQDRATAKLCRNLKPRYVAALDALVSVLNDIDADRRACDAIGREASEAGMTGLESAEVRLRKAEPYAFSNTFDSLTRVELFAWDGSRAWTK